MFDAHHARAIFDAQHARAIFDAQHARSIFDAQGCAHNFRRAVMRPQFLDAQQNFSISKENEHNKET